jgi:hypothetical protein
MFEHASFSRIAFDQIPLDEELIVICGFHACRPGVPFDAGPAFHGMTGRGEAGR